MAEIEIETLRVGRPTFAQKNACFTKEIEIAGSPPLLKASSVACDVRHVYLFHYADIKLCIISEHSLNTVHLITNSNFMEY